MDVKTIAELGQLVDMLREKGVYRYVSPALSIDIAPNMLYTPLKSENPPKKGAKASPNKQKEADEAYEYGEEQA
jgi:hypothetical protein